MTEVYWTLARRPCANGSGLEFCDQSPVFARQLPAAHRNGRRPVLVVVMRRSWEFVREQPQSDQRVSLRVHVEPMESAEVSGYVEHRLRTAGSEGPSLLAAEAPVHHIADAQE